MLAGSTVAVLGAGVSAGIASADVNDAVSVSTVAVGDGTFNLSIDFSVLNTNDSSEVSLLDGTGAIVSDDTVSGTSDSVTGIAPGDYVISVVSGNITAQDSLTLTDSGETNVTPLPAITTYGASTSGISTFSNGDGTDTVTVDFGSDTAAASGDITVTLLNQDGATLDEQVVASSVSSVTFTEASGATAKAVVSFVDGSGTTQSVTYDVPSLIYPTIPVDGPVVVVDPTTVTVEPNTDGSGWLVTFAEPDLTGRNGFFTVTDTSNDQGDSCSVPSVGVAGASDSCVLVTTGDTAPSVSISFSPYVIMYDRAGSVAPSTTTVPTSVVAVSARPVVATERHALSKSVTASTSSLGALVWVAGGLLVVAGGAGVGFRRSRRR
jgi:hypothetical protein